MLATLFHEAKWMLATVAVDRRLLCMRDWLATCFTPHITTPDVLCKPCKENNSMQGKSKRKKPISESWYASTIVLKSMSIRIPGMHMLLQVSR
jgi:hypothetical protein